ncbi:MAG: hypothetical protein ACFB00_03310 [Parvularculaceae bacterium]
MRPPRRAAPETPSPDLVRNRARVSSPARNASPAAASTLQKVAVPSDFPFGAKGLLVRGSLLEPIAKNGWVVIYGEEVSSPEEIADLDQQRCIVELETDEVLLRDINRGVERNKFSLTDPQQNRSQELALKWAAPVLMIYAKPYWI